jgi:DNA polymerase-3 subunit alpha
MDFVHLHLHTEYSSLDGIIKVSELPAFAKDNGMNAVAMTDHGNLGGALKFVKACQKAEVKPIIGIEAYAAEDRTVRDIDSLGQKYYHLLLLAMNETGYHTLVRLNNPGMRDGFYYEGRVDDALLEEYNEGLIATSACLGGRIAQLYKRASQAEAEKLILWYRDVFKDRFFLELQDHPTEPEQVALNRFLLDVSLKYDIPPIVACDCHYLLKDDGRRRLGVEPDATRESLHEQVLALSTGNTVVNDDGTPKLKRFSFELREHHVKTPKEILAAVKRTGMPLDCMSNTVSIANMCTGEYFTDIKVGKYMPVYPDIKYDPDRDLKIAAQWGLIARFGGKLENVPQEYRDRLDYELRIIAELGWSSYFLFVKDICDYARSRGIIQGPGRGSAGGSLVSWALKITGKQLDPIARGLYFERFLNPHRMSPPDIDLDFPKYRRHEIHEYAESKYGKGACASLGTYDTWKPRSIVEALARAQGHPSSFQRKLANSVPEDHRGKSPTMEKAIEASKLLQQHPEITEPGLKMDRMLGGMSIHASGYIIADHDLIDRIPCRLRTDKEEKIKKIVTQMDMGDVEEIGYIKFDFLGIKNLDVVEKTLSLIKKRHGIDIDMEEVPLDDPDVFDLICSGRLGGIFQLANSLRGITLRMQPREMEEISVINAIGRPGPLDAGLLDVYLECRQTGRPPDDMPPEMAEILKDTHYTFIYQEQIMRMGVKLAGFSLPDADGLRKAIGKKKPKEMAKYEKKFKTGAAEVGILSASQIDKLWDDLKTYADYCFNKAHSYAYSLLGYWECWLKTHYPTEFMAALMSMEEKQEKLSGYISEARSLGIDTRGPDVNESRRGFTIQNKKLRFGLESIKGLGKTNANFVIKARGKIPFKNFWDFMSRINRSKVTSDKVECLVKAGAFDSMGYDRAALLQQVKIVVEYYKKLEIYHERKRKYLEREAERAPLLAAGKKVGKARKLKKPEEPVKPTVEPTGQQELTLETLGLEREVLGCYMTMHPTDFVTATGDTDQIMNIFNKEQRGKINGVVCALREIITRKTKQKMAFLEVEDQTGRASVTVFPYIWNKLKQKPKLNDFIRVEYEAEDPESTPKKLKAKRLRMIRIK